MTVKEQFIRNLIDVLNEINGELVSNNKNPIDVCYVVSVIDQQIESCKEFMEDITQNKYRIYGFKRDDENYNGSIKVLIKKSNYEYLINFTEDERMFGYCECTSGDKYYNSKYQCCGFQCDWYAPAFELKKIINLNGLRWVGLRRDYWAYEEQFEVNEKNKNDDVEKHRKEQEKKYIENQIKEWQEKLKNLESNI